jgi:hypothetical protein
MTGWRVDSSRADAKTLRWELQDANGRALAFESVVEQWRRGEAFRKFWLTSLRTAPFASYAWECPPVAEATRSRPFECVFIESPSLARMTAEPEAFAEYFRSDRSVVTFGNLGGDATLVAPCPGGSGNDYTHLASFTATAPNAQQDALWQAVGEAMEKRIATKPVWLSTAGLGVGWLHIRLDDRPKYYRYERYFHYLSPGLR